MDKNHINIFLSASVPDPRRDPVFYKTADIVAIRDSVRALGTVILMSNKYRLIWGGHPAITFMIRELAESLHSEVKQHITLYQSNFFKDQFPKDNESFENIEFVEPNKDRDTSLYDMRVKMFKDNRFLAGVFIGGMEGVMIEFKLLKKQQPGIPLYPVHTTGGAARILYDEYDKQLDLPGELKDDYSYHAMFRRLFKQAGN